MPIEPTIIGRAIDNLADRNGDNLTHIGLIRDQLDLMELELTNNQADIQAIRDEVANPTG